MLGEPPAKPEGDPAFEIVHKPGFQYCDGCTVRRLAVNEALATRKKITRIEIDCSDATSSLPFDRGTVVYCKAWVNVHSGPNGGVFSRFDLEGRNLCPAHPGTPQSLK